jgi:hypothetical protein
MSATSAGEQHLQRQVAGRPQERPLDAGDLLPFEQPLVKARPLDAEPHAKRRMRRLRLVEVDGDFAATLERAARGARIRETCERDDRFSPRFTSMCCPRPIAWRSSCLDGPTRLSHGFSRCACRPMSDGRRGQRGRSSVRCSATSTTSDTRRGERPHSRRKAVAAARNRLTIIRSRCDRRVLGERCHSSRSTPASTTALLCSSSRAA